MYGQLSPSSSQGSGQRVAVEMLLSGQVFACDLGPQGAVRNLVYDYPVVLGAGVSAKYLEIPEQSPLSIRSSISCTETQECCPEIQGSRVGFEVDLSHPVRATVMCQLGP